MRHQSFQTSVKTEAALEVLGRARPGVTVTWQELTLAIGVDARTVGRHHVDSARRILLQPGMGDARRVFGSVRGVGLLCLDPGEVVRKGTHRRKKIYNQTRYFRREVDTIRDREAELKPEDSARLQVEVVMMTAIELAARHQRAEEARRITMNHIPPQVDYSQFKTKATNQGENP